MKTIIFLTTEVYLLEEFEQSALKRGDRLIVFYIGKLHNVNLVNCHFEMFNRLNIKEIVECLKNKYSFADIIFTNDEKLVDKMCEISELSDIKTYNFFENNYSRSKYSTKKMQKGENVPKISYLEEFLSGESDLEYPLVIKPDSGYGSSGVYLLKNELELETNMKKVAKAIKIMKLWSNGYNFNSEIVLEEYIEGKEYAIDMLWFKGEIVFSGICERLHGLEGHRFEDFVYYSKNLDIEVEQKINKAAQDFCRAFSFKTGATHTEMKITRDGKIYILDNALRPGGGGCFYYIYSLKYGRNFFEIYYDIMTDQFERSKLLIKEPDEGLYFLYCNLLENGGKIKNISFNSSEVPNTLVNTRTDIFFKKGDIIPDLKFGNTYNIFVFGKLKDNFTEIQGLNDIVKLNKCCHIEFENS